MLVITHASICRNRCIYLSQFSDSRDENSMANTTTVIDYSTGEEKRLNTNFAQVYDGWWRVQRSLLSEYPTAITVFSWLAEIADRRNAVIASYTAMSRAIGLNSRTIMRAVQYLAKKNIIKIAKSGNMNVYILNDRLIWRDSADSKDKYSQFSAEVYLVASEQEEAYKSFLIGHAVPKTQKKLSKSSEKAVEAFDLEKLAKTDSSSAEEQLLKG